MADCKWIGPGDKQTCSVMASPGALYCPRHEFLERCEQERARDQHLVAALKRKITTPMPRTRRELIQYGYQFCASGDCRGCGKHIEFWRTPNGNRAPYDPTGDLDSRAISHFATCTQANHFRRTA